MVPGWPPITLQKLPAANALQLPCGAPISEVHWPFCPDRIEHLLFAAKAEQKPVTVPGGVPFAVEQKFLRELPPFSAEQRCWPPLPPAALGKVEHWFCDRRA